MGRGASAASALPPPTTANKENAPAARAVRAGPAKTTAGTRTAAAAATTTTTNVMMTAATTTAASKSASSSSSSSTTAAAAAAAAAPAGKTRGGAPAGLAPGATRLRPQLQLHHRTSNAAASIAPRGGPNGGGGGSGGGGGGGGGARNTATRPEAASTTAAARRGRGAAAAATAAAPPSPASTPAEDEPAEPQPAPPGTQAAEWERVMDAKLAQWRFMNLVAVAELQAEERAACAVLVALTDDLEAAMDDVAALTARLDAVRAAAAGRTLAERAAPPLAALAASIEHLAPDHRAVCEALLRSLEELPLRNVVVDPDSAAALAREIARFRIAAVHFSEAAQKAGAREQCAIALEDLARVVADEAPGVRQELCRSVKDAVETVDANMAYRAADLSRRRKTKRSTSPSTTPKEGSATKARPRRVLSAPTASAFSSRFAIGQAT